MKHYEIPLYPPSKIKALNRWIEMTTKGGRETMKDSEVTINISRSDSVWERYTIQEFIDKYHSLADKFEACKRMENKAVEAQLALTAERDGAVEYARGREDYTVDLAAEVKDCKEFIERIGSTNKGYQKREQELTAEVERLKSLNNRLNTTLGGAINRYEQADHDIERLKKACEIMRTTPLITPPAPVVWVREDNSVAYPKWYACKPDGTPIRELEDVNICNHTLVARYFEKWWGVRPEVKVWEEDGKCKFCNGTGRRPCCIVCGTMPKPTPEPAEEWVYGVWVDPRDGFYMGHKNHDRLFNQGSHDTCEDAIAGLLSCDGTMGLMYDELGWSNSGKPPVFGVRRLREGEIADNWWAEPEWHAAFYNGKRINCTGAKNPKDCIGQVLSQLNNRKLADLEVVG